MLHYQKLLQLDQHASKKLKDSDQSIRELPIAFLLLDLNDTIIGKDNIMLTSQALRRELNQLVSNHI